MRKLREKTYDRRKAVTYAHQWAHSRNPKYYNFDPVGGDCTNFISQCLYAGCGTMNYAKDIGWYYTSANDRAAAWSGVEFLKKFLVNNKGAGPYAIEAPLSEVQLGDIIQLCFDGKKFGHSLFVVSVESSDPMNILVTTHMDDSDDRPLSSYVFKKCRLLHIQGVRG